MVKERRRNRPAIGRSKSFPMGTTLFGPDQATSQIYLLHSGHVRLSNGEDVIFDHLGPGDIFGENALLGATSKDRVAVTVSPVEVRALRKADLLGQLRQDPVFGLRLMKSMALRLHRYEQAMRDLIVKNAEMRLAHVLFRLAPSSKREGWVRLPFELTNPDLAKMVGTTRWRISHLLNRFQRAGWLRRQNGLWVERKKLGHILDS
jgi:CRP-like cAMP-binding protein